MILAQTRAGVPPALLLGATLGAIFVPAVGWTQFLAWYGVLAFAMLARMPLFHWLVRRHGPQERTLQRIAQVTAVTGWMMTLSVPLFSPALSVVGLGVLTIIVVGWVCFAVAVLAVQPRIYAVYLVVCLATVYVGWVGHTGARELLLMVGFMALGSPMLVRLARIVQAQVRDAVIAAE